MDFVKNLFQHHRKLFYVWVGIDIIIIFLPQWLDSVWSLAERIRGSPITMPQLAISLYWITVPVGLVMFGIAIWAIRSKPTAKSIGIDKTNKGLAIAKRVDSILEKIEKRDLQLKDASVRQYKALFSRDDFMALLKAIASTNIKYTKFERNMVGKIGGEQLRQDKIQRRQQIDHMFGRLYPIMEREQTFEKTIAYWNKLDTFPKMQNDEYRGIKTRRERDRRWRKLFDGLSKVKTKYPNIFGKKELDSMLDEYTDISFGGSSTCFIVELVNWYTTVDIQPTAYIDTGAYTPYNKIKNRMVKLREDISNKIIEIATDLDKAQEPTSKNNDGSSESKSQ